MRSGGWRRGVVGWVGVAAVAAIGLGPGEARATVPCDDVGPCHNNFGEPIVMFVLGADALGFGLVGTIGNAAALARNSRPGTPWLTIGYIGAAYNLALAGTWITAAGSSLSQYPDDSYARLQLGMGIAHLVFGAVTLGVTAAGTARRVNRSYALEPPVLPSFAAVPGGGALVLSGRF